MANKKQIDQLESLLDWEREDGRLPEKIDLFNRQISPSLILREVSSKAWELEVFELAGDVRKRQCLLIKHTTLINLGLTILDAVKKTEERYLKTGK